MRERRRTNSVSNVDSRCESHGGTTSREVLMEKELLRTREALKAATKRCRDLVRELDERTSEHESERALRDQQLSRILRALLVLEARLKQEQKSIRQLLCEKDNVIRNQQLEIAKLRRYTKNYIKSGKTAINGNGASIVASDVPPVDSQPTGHDGCSLSKDIERLKCEIIDKLNPTTRQRDLARPIKKTHSFAGSDISKTSLTSSENTDASIVTTTTDGSPSLLSTEGFCEGESTDASAGSTLDKSNRYTPTTVTDSENETTMVCDDRDEDGAREDDDDDEDEEEIVRSDNRSETYFARRGYRLSRISRMHGYPREGKYADPTISTLPRTESKDDGLDCNFLSDNDDKEPIYANARTGDKPGDVVRAEDDNNNKSDNGTVVDTAATAAGARERNPEESSVNWYSDPDEDRTNEDVFRHSSSSSAAYRASGNHNSVLECVNQILLRDMEEEESSVIAVTRRFKHRSRMVRFQPGKLSDIESVGSEMERRNSEEATVDNEPELSFGNFEPTASEDEFGMRIVGPSTSPVDEECRSRRVDETKAIPIVIIEPKPLVEETTCPSRATENVVATENLAKNLDYEDIESLPDASTGSPVPTGTPASTPMLVQTPTSSMAATPSTDKTPPALPPKPQFRNNTLVLKKIPSPSFLIDETRKKQQQLFESNAIEQGRRIFDLISSPLKRTLSSESKPTARTKLDMESNANDGDDKMGVEKIREREGTRKPKLVHQREVEEVEESGSVGADMAVQKAKSWRSRFENVRSSFQAPAKVTNIIRHFEEFKIGIESEDRSRDRAATQRAESRLEIGQEFDIGQNFEEFNLDECDLSDDGREEADGSERLNNLRSSVIPKENGNEIASSLSNSSTNVTGYDSFLEATGLSNKSILTPSRLLSNHKSMLKPKDVKYKSKIKATAILERHGISSGSAGNTIQTHVRHWTGPFV